MGISQARLGEHGQVQHEVKGLAVVSLDKMDHFVDSGTVRYQVVTVGLPGVGLPVVGLPVTRPALKNWNAIQCQPPDFQGPQKGPPALLSACNLASSLVG